MAPRASAALLDGLILKALERLSEIGVATDDMGTTTDPIESEAVPNAQATRH